MDFGIHLAFGSLLYLTSMNSPSAQLAVESINLVAGAFPAFTQAVLYGLGWFGLYFMLVAVSTVGWLM